MTDKVFLREMYQKDIDCTVTGASENGIFLDRTVFYATGGGQPNDTGKLISPSGKIFRVADVKKEGSDILHVVEDASEIREGDKFHGVIDWDRRYAHMRHHSAIHVLDGIVSSGFSQEGMLTGGQIYEDRARIDLDLNNFSRELVEDIIEKSNKFIREGHRIYQREVPREEALQMANLARTEPGRRLIENLDVVRIIVIDGLDEQADGGTHVSDSREIGKIVLKKIESKGKRNKRVEFSLENL
ncbi:alanyl-tRNA editing protein [Oxyplasma meridianum]|uniref:Alanyl-tRNA editing protein n=1 Tax=Oxyplasma meridianum TaxID=3073602 RepID=A0AAX4NHX4_9ARCH